MNDSYFLTSDKDKKSFSFRQFGCCEYAGDSFKKIEGIVYEFIDINEISNVYLKNKNIIEEYIYLISEFIGIELTREELPNKSALSKYNLPSLINDMPEEEYNERYICFSIGKYLSNKHFVAMHTLIRYLWFDSYYHDIVNISLNIRRYAPYFSIEDVFAVAHSFQNRTTRALTGKSSLDKFGFMYFRPQKEYLIELKKNNQFNSIFDDFEIILIPKIKIKGNFFDDSEVTLESKSFISFLTSNGNEVEGISERILRDVLDVYVSHKDIFLTARDFFTTYKTKYRINKFEINSDNEKLNNIIIRLIDNVNSVHIDKVVKSKEELNTFITELK